MKPHILLLLGDRNGVGPELIAKLLARPEIAVGAELSVLGDRSLLPEHIGRDVDWLDFEVVPGIVTEPGRLSAVAGAEMLETLKMAAQLHGQGAVDGIVFAPLNKQAIALADPGFSDEIELFARELGHEGPRGELNVLDGLWTARVTSHVALREVAERITVERILDAVGLVHGALVEAGNAAPRLAVAGLNPHAGDGGLFGREEIDIIAPAIERARGQGIDASGPFPADTVFVRARSGAYDAIVTMYHDQGQIAMKLMGFARGVTVLGGLPLPIATPAHGTAYDIAGRGVAEDMAMWRAFQLCRRMARARTE